jgi:MFS family permease
VVSTSPSTSADKKRTNAAWWGVVVFFLIHGLIVSSWISRIPAVQSALGLSNGLLGLTLLSSALGAVTTIQTTGHLVSKYGSRRVSTLASCLFCCSLVLPGLATGPWTLALALFIYGVMAAAMDVSMNAQGIEVERKLRRPTMSRFHGMYSLGAMAGAFLGGWLGEQGLAVLPHLIGSGLLNMAGILAASRLLTADAPVEEASHRLSLLKLPRVLLALSAIAFLMLVSEGAMADWIAVYLKQTFNANQGVAAAGFAVFSAAMALFRFLGDWVTARLGPLKTVRGGCLVAAFGVICALAAPSPLWSMPGFAIAGMGLSVIVPLVFGGGGRVPGVSPGPGIATVTGLGYLGFIVGPPTIGFASQLVTLRWALVFVVLCCLVAAALSGMMRMLERD